VSDNCRPIILDSYRTDRFRDSDNKYVIGQSDNSALLDVPITGQTFPLIGRGLIGRRGESAADFYRTYQLLRLSIQNIRRKRRNANENFYFFDLHWPDLNVYSI